MALVGNTNEEQIWNYLYEQLKNPYGVAGIMGNMYAESGLKPNNLQNSYEKKLGYTDTSYTSAVDKKIYTNFIRDRAGYGLVQWTYWSLKQELLTYAQAHNKSIGDLEMQLEFLCHQLSTSYKAVWNTCLNATTVLEASNAMLLKFERPADQSVAAQERRAGFGQKYFDKYAGDNPVVAVPTEKPKVSNTSVLLGHATVDENGRTTGGVAGDQNKKEVCTRKWYNKPWKAVYRPIDKVTAEKIAVAMEQACANDKIGYDQRQRSTLYNCAKKVDWDLSKITTACETDCSALVAVCVNAAGIQLSKDMNTRTEDTLLMRTGKFMRMISSQVVGSSTYLQRGDILLANGHTAVVLTNGPESNNALEAKSTGNTNYVGKGIGTAVSKGSMNIRTGAGLQYSAIGTLKAKNSVEVLAITDNQWYKIAWPQAASGYAYVCNTNDKYFTYTSKNNQQPTTTAVFTLYTVKVLVDALNIRKGPGVTYPVTGCIKDHGVYTITKEKDGWGYLKSGAGWIDLANTKRR